MSVRLALDAFRGRIDVEFVLRPCQRRIPAPARVGLDHRPRLVTGRRHVAVRRGETQIIADNCAQAILEDLRSRSFYNINVASPPTYQKWVYGGTDFVPTVTLAYDSDTNLEPFLKIATVNITWTFQNRTNSVVHSMYLNNITR